ncbi:Hydroxyisourate hydrolase [Pseudovirgaria hyperparasitica]|uniref:hydroxyisourate hydrolase n=1 Tax=Pseudovirgaria hyperparasitica TaxID=470096 RepID=A0A6A6WI91_9PEZI|nr:Hydroxyisourate hydrolase [Pseudovirgaria hyperparasitica]KAF2762508.1 Hydroxyisourate hydrolase [Pseudovirgaria hyperparasitica]
MEREDDDQVRGYEIALVAEGRSRTGQPAAIPLPLCSGARTRRQHWTTLTRSHTRSHRTITRVMSEAPASIATPSDRIQALTRHLSHSQSQHNNPLDSPSEQTTSSTPPSSSEATMATARPPITCHVLDTTTGRPGAGIEVTLTCHSPQAAVSGIFSATTNSDGRVTAWTQTPAQSPPVELQEIYERVPEDTLWTLTFTTGPYYAQKGIKPFFPEVDLKFMVRKKAEHYHVPLLLGPYNYTTYRGS